MAKGQTTVQFAGGVEVLTQNPLDPRTGGTNGYDNLAQALSTILIGQRFNGMTFRVKDSDFVNNGIVIEYEFKGGYEDVNAVIKSTEIVYDQERSQSTTSAPSSKVLDDSYIALEQLITDNQTFFDKVVFEYVNTKIFSLPANNTGVLVFKNGKELQKTTDYTIVEQTLEILSGITLEVGDIISVLVANALGTFVMPSIPSVNSNVFYVNGETGSNANNGSFNSPFLTITRGVEAVAGTNGSVIVSEGVYRETISLASLSSGDIKIIANYNDKVVINGGQLLANWVKTDGYTNIYEATFNGTFAGTRQVVLEDGRKSQLINEGDRHPYHKGELYRMDHSIISTQVFDTDLATTLTALDLNAGNYHFDSVNSKIYIHTTDSDSPIINEYNYEIPIISNAGNVPVGSTATLELHNITFKFSRSTGVSFGRLRFWKRFNCKCIGANVDGFKDDLCSGIAYNDEIYDCRDGVNGHWNELPIDERYRLSAKYGRPMFYYFNQWSHDNRDDGNSHHERGNVFSFQCLYEFNKKSGIAPSNSCSWTDFGSIMRYNKGNASFGEGVELINNVLVGDDAIGGCFTGHNTICYGNRIGFRVLTNANTRMILHNCVSRDNDVSDYRSENGTKIYANNCLQSNNTIDGIAKEILTGGEIIIRNDTLLT